MGQLVMFNLVSIDGYFSGPNGGLDWHNVDDEFTNFAIQQLNEAKGLVFGRITYEGMHSFWTSSDAQGQPEIADKMNRLKKVVVSRSLERAEWNNTQLVQDNLQDAFAKLKADLDGDILLFGSANLASTLTNLRLIDEYRLMMNPVILGQGVPLFQDIKQQLSLKLLKSRAFASGNYLLYYQVVD